MSEIRRSRARAFVSVNVDDESRAQQERSGYAAVGDPGQVERRLACAVEAFAGLGTRATLFAEGRLAAEIDRGIWSELVADGHIVGCQGLSRAPVGYLGPERFGDDARRGREALEDLCGAAVTWFRAPDFSADGCDPWFGAGVAAAGYTGDSSKRLHEMPESATSGMYELEGSDGDVTEVPLGTLPIGTQRAIVVGSASFRVLPLPTIRVLFEHIQRLGFVPQVVLNLGDFDVHSQPVDDRDSSLWHRLDHFVRHTGRASIVGKLEQLSYRWKFEPLGGLAAKSSG